MVSGVPLASIVSRCIITRRELTVLIKLLQGSCNLSCLQDRDGPRW